MKTSWRACRHLLQQWLRGRRLLAWFATGCGVVVAMVSLLVVPAGALSDPATSTNTTATSTTTGTPGTTTGTTANSTDATTTSTSTTPASTTTTPQPGTASGAPSTAGATPADAQAAYEQWQTWLAQPAQVSARASSQTAYENQSGSQALSTDTSAFAGWIGQPGYTVPTPAGGKVVGQPGESSETVKNSDGSQGVLVSGSPLDGTTPAGSTAPLDLTLAGDGVGSYEPKSSVVPVTVPSSSTGALSFTQAGFGVSFATGSAVSGQQQGGTVFYPNVGGAGSDTDAVVDAIPDGAEVTYMLRSVQSPTTQTLIFDLPSGWSLTPSAGDPANISLVNESGTVEATVMAPVAIDAQGQSVPASYQLQGSDQIVLTVQDQGGGYDFPIEVDPGIVYAEPSFHMFDYWQWYATNSEFFPLYDSGDQWDGLAAEGDITYSAGQRAAYTVFTPSWANIYEYYIAGVHSTPHDSDFQAGIEPSGGGGGSSPWFSDPGNTTGETTSGSLSGWSGTFCLNGCNPDTGGDGDEAAFKLWMTGGRITSDAEDWTDDEVALAVSDDAGAPSLSVSASPGNATWIDNDNVTTGTADLSFSQSSGLGVDDVSLNGPGGTYAYSSENECGVNSSSNTIQCTAVSSPQDFSYSTSWLSSGLNTLSATADGYDGLSTTDTWSVGVDDTTPSASFTGALGPSGGGDAIVPTGANSVTATATDSVSGIASTSATLDGNPVSPTSGSTTCSSSGGGCSVSPSWSFSSAQIPIGWHNFTTQETNLAGTSASSTDMFAVVGAPSVSGTDQVGDTLTATPASFPSYPGEPSPSYSYQWVSCDPTGNQCVDIPGATGSQYTLDVNDVGSTIQVQETASVTGTGMSSSSSVAQTTAATSLIEPASGPACTDSWIGATSYFWADASNWSTGSVPGASDVVCMRAGYSLNTGALIASSSTVEELEAQGAWITVNGGATLTLSSTSTASGISWFNLGDSSGAGTVSVADELGIGSALNWVDGTLEGGTVTLAGPANSTIEPATATDVIALDGTDLLNKGGLTAECSVTTDTSNSMTLIEGEDGAKLDNEGSLSFNVPNGSSAPYGCEFQDTSGAASTFENNGVIHWSGNDSYDSVNIGWLFDNSNADSDVDNAIVDLYGGQTAPISGHWNGASLNLMAGGSYSITSDLADFGSEDESQADLWVAPAPGSWAATTAYTSFLADTTAASALTITAGEWQNGWITVDGPLTLGQAGQVTTVSNIWNDDGQPITVNGTVNAYSYNADDSTLDVASGGTFNVYGTTGLSGTETVSGGGSVDFEGPMDLSSNSTIDASGGVVLQGQVSGTGNLAITTEGPFYEQGGIDIAGNLSVNSNASDMQLAGPVTATNVSLATGSDTSGSVDIQATVTDNDLTVQAGSDIDVDAALQMNNVSLDSPGSIEIDEGVNSSVNAITLSGGGVTTNLSSWIGANTWVVDGEVLDNENTIGVGPRFLAENGAQILNDGYVWAYGSVFSQASQGPPSQFINESYGQVADGNYPSQPADLMAIPYSGPGSIANAAFIINDAGQSQYGGANPAMPNMVAANCDHATDCGNGDQTEDQTDLTVQGLGGPLALTRSYSSRLASAESTPGMFGYGWTTPFEQRVYCDPADNTAEVVTTTGSTAAFTPNSSCTTFTPASGVYATLTWNSSSDTFSYVQPDQTTTVFNADGEPLSVTDRQGQTTTYTYTDGQLTQVTAPSAATGVSGRSITFTYNSQGLVATASDPAGLTVSYGYDSNDNLTSVTDSQGANNTANVTAWQFQYDDDAGDAADDSTDLHELTSMTDADSNTTTIAYQAGYVVAVTDPLSRTETWQYLLQTQTGSSGAENSPGETIQTSPAGNVTQYLMNTKDEPTEIVNGDGSIEQLTYDSNGNKTSQTDGNGGVTTNGYDVEGNQVCETTPTVTAEHGDCPDNIAVGSTGPWPTQATATTYNSERDVVSQTQPSGMETTYSYNSGGQPTSIEVSPPSGSSTPSQTTTMAYNSYEELTSETTQDGDTTSYTYDSYGDPATKTDQLGNETTYGYDADGREVCTTTPRVTAADGGGCSNSAPWPSGAALTTYDALGDVLTSTTPGGNMTTYTYDQDRSKVSATDPDGNETTYGYDADGELTSTTYGAGTSSATTDASTYDPDGNLATQTNGDGSPDTYTYTYTPMDQVWMSTDPMGNVTCYGYDWDGNLTSITYPAKNSSDSGQNCNGETTTYSYDADDRRTGVSYSDGETSTAYSYTPDGQISSMTDTSGTTSYSYDGLDRLSSVDEDGRTVTYGYNGDNDQTSIEYPNSQSITRTFNGDDELTSVKDWVGSGNTTSFSYDDDSQLASTAFPSGTSETDSYGYNLDDAPTSIDMAAGSTTLASLTVTRDSDDLITNDAQTGLPGPSSDAYTYTPELELASDTPAGSSASGYTYDKARNITELNGSGASSLAYNDDSELTSGPAGSYTYNALGERAALGTSSSYTYNADQNLTAANTTGGDVSYSYNGGGQLMSSTTGSTTTNFTWDDTATNPQLLQAGNEYYIYGPNGQAIEQISSGGTIQYLHQDQIGTTRLITNTSGSTIGTFTYNPYGGLLSSTGSATSLLGYAGQYTDPITGLQYDQARWYDPSTGQFMVVDPKVETTWQAYAYADDDPLSTVDPSGEEGCPYVRNHPNQCKKINAMVKKEEGSNPLSGVEHALSTALNTAAKVTATAGALVATVAGAIATRCMALAGEEAAEACAVPGVIASGASIVSSAADAYLTATGNGRVETVGLDGIGDGFAAGAYGMRTDPEVGPYMTVLGTGASALSALWDKFSSELTGH